MLIIDNTRKNASRHVAVLTVNAALSVGLLPTNSTLDIDQSKQLAVTIEGGTLPYTFQWYLNDAAASGATNSTWIFKPTSTGSYSVSINVTDNLKIAVESNIETITVSPAPSVTISPNNVTFDIGQSHTFTSIVSGGTSPYSYQWYLNGTAVLGATNSSWTFKPSSSASYVVSVKITDWANATAASNSAQITVKPTLSTTTILVIIIAIVLTIIAVAYIATARRKRNKPARTL